MTYVLYDIEAQVPAFYTATSASKHYSIAMSSIRFITYPTRLVTPLKNSMRLSYSLFHCCQNHDGFNIRQSNERE